ncbi:MAG: RHS repeat-associated core domain-containing protein, partial [Candidatus Omnitrophota bacterium]|nr:RHS repeat-associated core domain-containing protein [Candidatus Omnitrophota bacterium]
YDGDGGRVKVTSLRGEAEAISTTYIGSTYEIEAKGAATKISKHIFLGSTRICTVESSLREGVADEAIYYFHQDHIGSSNVVTDETGTIAKLIEYSPYGLTSRDWGEYNTNCRFTGKLFDTSTALYYYGARYYDPELGRFIQPDTIVPYPDDPQSFNRYAYARNNPIKYIDPTGHSWLSTLLGAIAGIIVGIATQNFALGMAVFSAVSAGISAYQAGGSFLQVAGISIVASIAGYYGASLGAAYGSAIGGGSFGAAVFAGMFGGAASGATQAALTGGDVVRETLIGGGIGTGMGIMIGGFTYTKPSTSQTPDSGSQNSPEVAEAIKSGDFQGAQDTEASSSNQPRYLSQKSAAEKIAEAAKRGSVGVGNNPIGNMPTPQEAREFYRKTVGPVGEMLMGIEAMATDLAGVFIKGVDWAIQGIQGFNANLAYDTGKGIRGHFDAYLRNPNNKPQVLRDYEAGTYWNPWKWDPWR